MVKTEGIKKPPMRITDMDWSLIKYSFAEDDETLKAMRKVFFQIPLDETETNLLKSKFEGKTLLQELMNKMFLPEITGDEPLGQTIDLWMTVDIKDKVPAMARLFFDARGILIDYVQQQLDIIYNISKSTISAIMFDELEPNDEKTDEDMYTDVVARNTIISHVEQQLNAIQTMAGTKIESVEETKKRLAQDSSK